MLDRVSNSKADELLQSQVDAGFPIVTIALRNVIGTVAWEQDRIDDMRQEGVIGLILASKDYDGRYGASFKTYAVLRVEGTIRDYLRSTDWVGRYTRKKINQVDTAKQQLEQRLQRESTQAELADSLGITKKRLLVVLGDALLKVGSVSEISQGSVEPDQDYSLECSEIRIYLDAMMTRLTDIERRAITMSFYEEARTVDIARYTGCSESNVSNAISRGLVKLRNWSGHGIVNTGFADGARIGASGTPIWSW